MSSIFVEALKLAASIVICQMAGVIGLLGSGDVRSYYQKLEKPPFAPPPSIFGPAWILLYSLMGVSAYLVLRRRTAGGMRAQAASVFSLQLALNAAWTPVFFGLKQPGWAFVVIASLFMAIAATLIVFWPISVVAALLLVPYLLWVAFAGALNFEIWRRNEVRT